MHTKLIVAWLAILTIAPALFAQGGAAIASPDAERALIARYCLGCHSQNAKKAGMESALRITLDDLDTAHVEKNPEEWERVVRKIRAGMMPPSGMPRPDAATYESMTAFLETELDRHAVSRVPPPGLHRMNRTEYANAIRDLLALEIDPSKYLPSDDSTRGFDNIAGALSISPALLESYVSAAAKISRMAMGRVNAPSETVYRAPEDTSQELHIEGMPFRTRGGMKIEHEFPADGEYGFSIYPINKGNMDLNTAFGDIHGEKLDLLIDGERVKLFDWDKDVARGNAVRNGTTPVKVPLKAGHHTVIVTFLQTTQVPGLDLNQHFMRSTIETGDLPGYNFFPQLGKVTISGPFDAKPATDSPSRQKIFACKPANSAAENACAKQIVNTLARRAFRRSVTTQDTELLMSFYQQGRNTSDNNGSFDQGIEMALNRILADPEFIFRKEVPPASIKPGEKYRLNDTELASRLSFFLWSSIPDDQLLTLAGQNKLHDPATLEQQVKRMLADPRSDELVSNFAGQWLNLRGLQSQSPTVALFPDFDDNLRQSLRTETEMFVDSVVHEDRSVIDLMDGDYTFVNERLAKHYGMPDIYGSRFRRVTLGSEFDMRRGLLGKGSILAVSSHPERTMPPIRGKTVMQIFLGVSPPNPPPNVPDLPKSASTVHGGAKPTMRQQLESHRKVEPCASCHKIMDPIGFSLENFDAIGRWRATDEGSPIDAAGQLVDGSKLDGVASLRQALLKYKPQFVRVVTEKLMIYALGRGTEYYDMPLVRSIVRDAERNNYKFSSLVLGVVKSEPFQTNMKSPEPAQAVAGGAGSRGGLQPARGFSPAHKELREQKLMFITKKHISRRTILRGAGVTIALPLLDSMIPAQTPLGKTAANPKTRFTGIFVPHGMGPGWWVPEAGGPGEPKRANPGDPFAYPMIMKPLEPLRDQVTIMSGLWSKSAEPPPGVTGADHWVAAAYLCGNKPKKTTGADIYDGVTIDQLIAQKIGQETLLPSLELGVEDAGANSSNCGEGYSCAYTNSISWQSPSQPNPMEINPQVVFERLFGDGSTPAERAARRNKDRSILDSVTQSLARFKRDIDPGDRTRLDEYLEGVREIERRLQVATKASAEVSTDGIVVPTGVPQSFDEHIKLQFDLQLLAFRGDITRVTTLLYARDLTSRSYPESGVRGAFHGLSHHAEDPATIADYAKLNQYHVQCLAYYLDKLKKTPDGDGSLLDHSLVLYGSNMGNSNQHLHYDVPHLLAGGASGQLKGNRHLAFPTKTVTTGNMLLSILNMFGVHQDSIGDSTGYLTGLV